MLRPVLILLVLAVAGAGWFLLLRGDDQPPSYSPLNLERRSLGVRAGP